MSRSVRAILCAIVLLLCGTMPGFSQSWEHSKWLNLPMERLVDMADKDIADGNKKDTALMCFTIVANRYESSLSQQQKVICQHAVVVDLFL